MSPGRTANQHLPRPESWIEAERPPWLHLPAESRRISLDEVVHSIPPVWFVRSRLVISCGRTLMVMVFRIRVSRVLVV